MIGPEVGTSFPLTSYQVEPSHTATSKTAREAGKCSGGGESRKMNKTGAAMVNERRNHLSDYVFVSLFACSLQKANVQGSLCSEKF